MNRRLKLALSALLLILLGWVLLNPPGRFGICQFFGVTTYSSVPRIFKDIQINCLGELRQTIKTHELKLSDIDWLLSSKPDVLIISLGWSGAVKPETEILNIPNCQVILLKTQAAMEKYNELKKLRKKVAIHIHSTC